MADYSVKVPLADHKRGDRWPGIPSIGPVVINGSQPAATLARIRMQFRHSTGSVFCLDSDAATSPDAPIVIDNATTWAAHVAEVQSFLPLVGRWDWDMEFYETGSTGPLTLYRGQLTVHADITK